MNPLLEQFLQEARENLSFIDQNLENIGSEDPELLNSVFRAAHTLKGGSGIVGFESVKQITHSAEDLLDMLRGGKLVFAEGMVEALYNAFDEVMNLIEAAEESEEIVEVDSQRIAAIIDDLNAQMGKQNEDEAPWQCPFRPIRELSNVVNMQLDFLQHFDETLPFRQEHLSEALLEQPQLYAVYFDVDDSCMVYGNDPVYTLSLLGEQVVGIHACMHQNSARAILSGMEDPDGLILNTQLTAFIYAPYAQIEDALFNFIDELEMQVLDIATLLGVDEGESGHQLDLLKELHVTSDTEELSHALAKVMPLIGNETLQYRQLQRLNKLLDNIEVKDLPALKGFFAALRAAVPYSYETADDLPQEVPVVAKAASGQSEVAKSTLPDAVLTSNMTAIYAQQYRVLELLEQVPDGWERVVEIMERLRRYEPQMPQFETPEAMKGWLRVRLGYHEEISESHITPAAPVAPEPTVTKPEVQSVVMDVPEESSPVHIVTRRGEPGGEDKKATTKNVIGKTVKIDQESIDHLMNIVGELLVAKNSLPYLADNVHTMNNELIKRAIMEKYTFINRLSEQLQDLIMSMRMLPISYVFDRYPKLVREISKNLGKKVRLVMNGGETKLDKNMIEMLADPMIHIMRNSLDHGIETPEVRRKKGKDEEGLVSLNAYAQSDKIIIEIIDDGTGINIERVVQKVLEKGLMSLEQVEALSDKERAELVLLAGLSTVDTISEYSGRGVGMDVVRKSIESFGGTIGIATKPNQGTTITLSIPVSLAVTSLLHITMSGVHYGLPMENVNEIVKIERDRIEYLHNEPFVYIRGDVIPLLFIKSMLDEKVLHGKALPIVVLSVKGNLLAVVVNELLGQLDVVQKPLEGVMENHPIFSGTALLGNGQIIMVLDPIGVLGIAHQLKLAYEQVG